MLTKNVSNSDILSVRSLDIFDKFVSSKKDLTNNIILNAHINALKIDIKNKTRLKVMLLIPFICFAAYSTEMSMAIKSLIELAYVLSSVLLIMSFSKKMSSDYLKLKAMLDSKEQRELDYILSANPSELNSIMDKIQKEIESQISIQE